MIKQNIEYEIHTFPPGQEIPKLQPFDILLTRRLDGYMGKLIAWFTKGFYSHVAIARDHENVQEALEFGVEVENVRKYKDHYYAIIRLKHIYSPEKEMLQDFMNSVLDAKENRYGYFLIASIVLSIISGHNIMFGASTGTMICSGFVCETVKYLGFIFPKLPAFMTPQDIAEFFGVDQPTRIQNYMHEKGFDYPIKEAGFTTG